MNNAFFLSKPAYNRASLGFTLVELLAVIGLILILMTMVLPNVMGPLAGVSLRNSGQRFVDQLLLARQTAITSNREVEVRFYEIDFQGQKAYRSMQLWKVDASGVATKAIANLVHLPENVIINTEETLSPLIFRTDAPVSGTSSLTAHGNCQYRGFRFRATGEPDLSSPVNGNAADFLTLQNRNEAGAPPANFFAIRINPLTGRVTSFQP